MRTNILRKAVITLMLSVTLTISAQKEERPRIPQEKMAEAMAKNIATNMKLEGATYDKFIDTYESYRKEMWAIMPKHGKPDKRREQETEEKVAERMKENFERSQKLLDIRTKYYHKFSGFLTQRQIEQMYKQERKMAEHLKARNKHHKPHKGDKPAGNKGN